MKIKAELMDKEGMGRALVRMSHQIIEKNNGSQDICLVGIRRRGSTLAEMIKRNISMIENVEVPCGDIDISHYRDDLTRSTDEPVLNKVDLPFSVVNNNIILVDDVFYTGRTARAAIEAIFALGRPKSIQLAVLIDRGHRELPIRADYVGKNVPTSKAEVIKVMVPPYDDNTAVLLCDL